MTSKRKWIFGVMVVPVATMAGLDMNASARSTAIEESNLVDVLSGVDFIPEREDLDILQVGAEELIYLARDLDQQGIDPGVRVRAYSALSRYDMATEAELQAAIAEHDDGPVSTHDFVYLRAAMESLAQVGALTAELGEPPAATTLVRLLDHQNRDIRTTAARAIGTYGTREVDLALADVLCERLEARLVNESVVQVQKALATALDDIDAAVTLR